MYNLFVYEFVRQTRKPESSAIPPGRAKLCRLYLDHEEQR
jgi:hypothetical protein